MKEFIITYVKRDDKNYHNIYCNSYAEAVCVAQPLVRDESVEFVQIDVHETLKNTFESEV